MTGWIRQLTAKLKGAVRKARANPRLLAFDAVLVATGYAAVLLLRFDGSVPPEYWRRFLAFVPVAVLAHLASNTGWGLYRQVWRHASVHEARRVLLAGLTVVAVVAPLYLAFDARPVPASVLVLGALVATGLLGLFRFQGRLRGRHRRMPTPSGLRVLVVGAGEAGAAIVREMQRKESGLVPVAVVDDDPRKQGLALLGVPVAGETTDVVEVVGDYRVHRVLLAIPTAGQELVRRVAKAAEEAGVPLQVVPELGDLISGRVSLRDVRDLRIEDLIGRQQAKTDLEAVHRLLAGRRVMITGGGGSIGAELARQVSDFSTASLVLLDNDETHLHDATASLRGAVDTVLCDIRSTERLLQIFERFQPEIVFHAAALKHVPVLESHPSEAIETNVFGTRALMDVAAATGVERLVFISTDKAVRPSSVMGASKWLGEQIVLARASDSTPHCAVRFGNVVGSRGSVIPTFTRQIAVGGPVTVTDPNMTRYFMSIEEAVQLVLQAAVFATGGEIFMLEMGEPVNILDLAERMITLSGFSVGKEIEIDIVGARPGEKLTEELQAADETCEPTPHESIVRLEPSLLPDTALGANLDGLTQTLARKDDEEAARRVVALANGVHGALEPDLVIDLTALERSERWNRLNI